MTPLSAPPSEIYWRTTVPDQPNHKMLLLTIGRVAVVGKWEGDVGQFYDAWSPLPKMKKR